MAGYIGSKASVVSSGAERKKVFDITTTTTSLTGCSYTPNQVHVYHNGVRLVDGTDYTATDGSTITLTTAAQSGDEVVVISYATFQTSDTVSASAGGTFSNAVTIDGNLTVDTNTLFVDSTNDRVGIGTTSPSATLHVNKGTSANSAFPSGDWAAKVFNSTDSIGENGLIVANRWAASTSTAFEVGGLFDNGDGFDTFLKVDGLGSVGIGTSSPQREVQIHDASATNAFLAINHTGVGSGATDGMLLGVDGNNDAIIHNYENSNMIFRTNDIERMRIGSSGKLLVGRTGPDGPTLLQVDAGTGGNYGIGVASGTTSTVYVLEFRNANGVVGSITTANSATSYNTSSDYRLKQDVQPMNGASDRVLALNPVNFAWKVDGTRVDGFLAHEAQEVVPEAVHGSKDAVDADGNPVYQGIDQSKLVPLLTAALQEALQKIDALEARVATLEGGAA